MDSIESKYGLDKIEELLKDKVKTCVWCYYDYFANGNTESYHSYNYIYNLLNEEEKLLVHEQIKNIFNMKNDNPNDAYRSIIRH